MIFIPGILIAILTFPGVIIHELAHQMFCRFYRVAIFDVCYMRFKNPHGYVVHEIPSRPGHDIMIGVGPFFVNTILGALITLSSAMPVIKFGSGTLFDYFLMWLGVSISMHAFPSTQDAQNILQASKSRELPLFARIITKPVVWIIYLFSAGSIIWLDYFYGLGVAIGIPYIAVKVLA